MCLCIYRKYNSGSPCCFIANKNSEKYCIIHSNNYNIVYDIINNAINRNEINSYEIYNIFKYIYNNPEILTKEFIFKACLKTLYSSHYLHNHYYKSLIYNDNLINDIYLLNLNTYNIEKNNYDKYKIINKLFLYKLLKKHIYNPNIILNNTEDPFTMDNINEINKNKLFIYNENNTNYFFIATELKYFIDTNGNWNPYTKREFSPTIIKSLNNFITYFNLDCKKHLNKYEWNTTHQAYTDVSQIIEKIGFYNDTRWFLKLTSSQIKNIIKTFKIVSRENPENTKYFINITDNNIFYDFAREIIRLFENGTDEFLLCCNFIKSIALYSDDFYNNIPEWLSDIEMPEILSVNTINRLIFNSLDILYFININNNE
jgi:virulence-associated protein VapD